MSKKGENVFDHYFLRGVLEPISAAYRRRQDKPLNKSIPHRRARSEHFEVQYLAQGYL